MKLWYVGLFQFSSLGSDAFNEKEAQYLIWTISDSFSKTLLRKTSLIRKMLAELSWLGPNIFPGWTWRAGCKRDDRCYDCRPMLGIKNMSVFSEARPSGLRGAMIVAYHAVVALSSASVSLRSSLFSPMMVVGTQLAIAREVGIKWRGTW